MVPGDRPVVALLGGLTLEIYLTQTAWIRWLETQSLPDGPITLLLLALVPLLVFAVAVVEAVARQMDTLPFYNSFFQTTNVPAVELAAKLASLAPTVGDRSFKHVFFSSSGSESNDTNVRMARRYWDLLGQPQRKVIISRLNAYHGSTLAAASLGGMTSMHAQGGLPIPITTPAHGTAYDIAGLGKADVTATANAFAIAARMGLAHRASHT